MFCTDDGRNAESDGNDGRFTGKACFFRYDSAGAFHIFYKVSTSGAENQDAAVREVLLQVFQRFGNANFTDSRVAANAGTAKEDVADNLNADHVGRTGFRNRDTGRQDDEITGFDEVVIEGCKDSIVDDSIRVNGFFPVNGLNAPVEL